MKIASIVAEYNPFHLGHQWQIDKTKEQMGADCGIVAVMSGHWVQSADSAVVDKWTRAKLALMGGVDLVLELPLPYALSSAEFFARGAIGILAATGLEQRLSFGSELGDIAQLQRVVTALEDASYPLLLHTYLAKGVSFPMAREQAVSQIMGCELTPLSTPNNNLGVEYLRAISIYAPHISAMTVKRRGAGHQSHGVIDGFASATQIRQHLINNQWDCVEGLMPKMGFDALKKAELSQLRRCEQALLYQLRTMTVEQWAALPDSGEREGLPVRLYQCARQATSVDEFLTLVKTKRYTHARLRRLLLWAFLGISAQHQRMPLSYLRVLGTNDTGRQILREMKEKATLPIVTNAKEIRGLSQGAQELFALECRGTDLYGLTFEEPWSCGMEWIKSPVVV